MYSAKSETQDFAGSENRNFLKIHFSIRKNGRKMNLKGGDENEK